MRVVLDTNVLVRAVLNPEGLAHRVFKICSHPPHALLISDVVLEELARVLRYDRLRSRHRLTDADVSEIVERLREAGELVVTLTALHRIVSADPDDDHIIQTAVAGNADVICTLDRHFRETAVKTYCNDRGILILSDAELLDLLLRE